MLQVSSSGFHARLKRQPCARIRADLQLLVEIRRLHVEYRENYGGVKTWLELNTRGIVCGKQRVARMRRTHGIEARRRRRVEAPHSGEAAG